MWTIPVGLKTLIGKYNVEWGLLMAGGVMALIPTALMFAGDAEIYRGGNDGGSSQRINRGVQGEQI